MHIAPVRSFLLFIALFLPVLPAHAGEDLQAVLDRHLRTDVAWWLDEPRLQQLLREQNQKNAALTDAELVAMDAAWRAELASDSEKMPLADVLFSRFASKYFAEVVLRVGGAYTRVLALDRRGLLVAADDMTPQMLYADDHCLKLLAQNPAAPWVQDVRPQPGVAVHVAMPIIDPDNGERLGTLLLDIDASRLPGDSLSQL